MSVHGAAPSEISEGETTAYPIRALASTRPGPQPQPRSRRRYLDVIASFSCQ
ncbi:hypothetical protein HMPREF0185_00782 [Brevundimonas diminuta 470-4]|nr:hypothetical protein HMPREF0185_00782 [Brevundimonas diminuta 470-4]